jgi:hypothetical protein
VNHEPTTERAARTRDAGLARLRRLTGAAIGTAVALSAVFAGVAASSTHPHKGVRTAVRRPGARPPVPQDAAAPKLPPPRAPAVAAQAPVPPPAAPTSAPVESPPVAVSGSS